VKRNSKWLLFVFAALLVSAVAWKYSVFLLERDFLITDHIPCDPALDSCFVQDCDPVDAECDSEPYKKIEKSAAHITMCPNYLVDQCPALTCETGETDCVVTLCSDETVEEGEVCMYTPGPVLENESEMTTEEIIE
jgi:hypothetical protein